ncbi:hypothetical protein KNT87_gp081 [Erwinia phage Cronus]|uniref:Uncharacterized protein n=1 Tax=Erwinia phage Cronus TaxID=2163633 RepID=A0A2S1GMC2_9CAUD|nr:hypothetical protein KNT87_gp081 [Erwinia phage Cronus]AWD90520.1 hypothetical protein [Erwinia phage Cronus]
MILLIALVVIVYLIVGYLITLKALKDNSVNDASDFWFITCFWLPVMVAWMLSYIVRGVLYTPVRIANWHMNKFKPKSKIKISPQPPRKP